MPGLAEHFGPLIEHDRDRAIRELKQLVAQAPRLVLAQALLMRAYHRCLDFENAAAQAETLLALSPEDSEALHVLALSQMALGDDEAALASYRRSFQVTSSAISLYGAALLLHRLGRLAESRATYEQLAAAQLSDPIERWPALRGLIALARDQGDFAEADRRTNELTAGFAAQPSVVSSFLVLRDHAFAFSEWFALAEKSRLAEVLKRGRATDPAGARFPETFHLPSEREALETFAGGAPAGTLFIVKPIRGSGGQGISLADDVAALADRQDVVVQRYVERPYLIDGRKGHLRIYALITSAEPLRAYVYEEGIVRLAPEPYDLGSDRRFAAAMHVTNTALHLGHPDLVVSDDPRQDDVGAVRSLSAVLRRIAAEGGDPQAVLGDIRELVGWFLRQLRREGLFARQAAGGRARSFGPKLLGFDMLLDDALKPWLIEIQTSPAARGSPLVDWINAGLFEDIFRMTVGLVGEPEGPAALERRELAIERANLGRFRPLQL